MRFPYSVTLKVIGSDSVEFVDEREYLDSLFNKNQSFTMVVKDCFTLGKSTIVAQLYCYATDSGEHYRPNYQ
jgi:hypothetical protein